MRGSLFLISIAVISFSVFAQKSLVLVHDAGPARYDIPVIQEVENTCIVLADVQQLNQMKTRQLPYTMLDNDTQGKKYFLVYPMGDDPAESVVYDKNVFAKYGRVLATFTSCLLMESTDAKLGTITEYNTRLVALGQEPIDYTCRTIIDTRSRPAPYDPLLQEILDRVSEDSCEQHLRDLCAIHNRDIKGDFNQAEAMPYFIKKLEEYGCDSIIELPINAGKNSTVAGVRFGIIDPTINQFTLIGGHSDTKGVGEDGRHQGANDNASGAVGVLEAARVYQHYEFDYTIIYTAHNGEEYGFLGSEALVDELKRVDAKVVGGVFSYDMLGVKGSSIRYEAYNGNDGAEEFVDRINELVDTYKPYNVTSVEATSNSSQPTDVTTYWNNGYVCAWHRWGSGYGSIHTVADSIRSDFEPGHLTGATKTGILVTAFYANPRDPVGIKNTATQKNKPVITWKQTAVGTIIIAVNTKKMGSDAVLEIFDLHGRLLRRFNLACTDSGVSTLTWNSRNNNGAKAAHALVLLRYKDSMSTSAVKVLVK